MRPQCRHQDGGVLLDRQRADLRFALARAEHHIADRFLAAPQGRGPQRLLSFFAWRRRRHQFIAIRRSRIHRLAATAIIPFIADYAVPIRGSARHQRTMPRRCHGLRIGIMAIGEPGAFGLQAFEASLSEQVLPFNQVVAAHLVEHQDDGELGFA